MIAIILGGAPSVWRELAEAQALLNRRHIVVAANLAGIEHAGALDGWASLHPDHFAEWRAARIGPAAARYFSPTGPRTPAWVDLVEERWPGSSGLYALQVALFEMGATAGILCGVPMEQTAGHFTDPGAAWADTGGYLQAFRSALPEIGGRVRSMGGWTASLFGKPSAEWVEAVDNIRPMGVTRPQHEDRPMHHVENVSEETQPFHAVDTDGLPIIVRLEPGEAGAYSINPHQAAFQTGFLKVSESSAQPAPKKAAPRKPAAKKAVAKAKAPAATARPKT